MFFQKDHQLDILSPGRKWDILSLVQFVAWGESGTFCHLGQFVAQKMLVGQFVIGTKCLLTVLLIYFEQVISFLIQIKVSLCEKMTKKR